MSGRSKLPRRRGPFLNDLPRRGYLTIKHHGWSEFIARMVTAPFRVVGARWLTDAAAVTRAMNAKNLPGVRFEAVTRRIARGQKFGGETIPMVRIIVTDRNKVRSAEIGAHLLREIYSRHPTAVRFQTVGLEELSGSRALRTAVQKGGIDDLLTAWRSASEDFSRRAERWRLY